jgi:hypothetical protein
MMIHMMTTDIAATLAVAAQQEVLTLLMTVIHTHAAQQQEVLDLMAVAHTHIIVLVAVRHAATTEYLGNPEELPHKDPQLHLIH